MWYRTGTITLKKGTTKVLGVGTKWAGKLSNVEAGQPLIVNNNIYEITEVRSDTELYIKETSPVDVTNSAYVIMSVVYGSLGDVALKASKALAHYQEQMDTFDMMYTGTQKFKVTKPDGTEIEMQPYSILHSLMDNYLLKDDNLAGLKDKAKAQENLQVFKQLPDTTADDNLNDLWRKGDVGIRGCPSTSASIARNYPIEKAGCLIVTPVLNRGYLQVYFDYSGGMYQRSVNNTGGWTTWTEYANLNLANVFTKGQKLNTNGDAITIEIPEGTTTGYIRWKKSDGTLIGTIGKVGSKDSFMIGYGTLSKPLEFTPDGDLLFGSNKVLTTGNAAVSGDIGSDFLKETTAKVTHGSVVTGSSIDTSLAGTWVVMSSMPFVFGTVTKYATLYRRKT